MTQNNNNTIWLWVAGVLITIIGALSSVAYANATARITDLEQDRKAAVLRLEEVKTQLAVLQSKLEQVDAKQNDIRTDIATLQDSFRLALQRGSNDSARWNRAMDQWPPKKK